VRVAGVPLAWRSTPVVNWLFSFSANFGRFIMQRLALAVLVLVMGPALTGCSIVGTWDIHSVDDDAAEKVEFKTIIFDDGGKYNAKSADGAMEIGDYKWTGTQLSLTPKNGTTKTYAGTLRMDGKLELYPDGMMTLPKAILIKQEAPAPAAEAENK
jgi:hypothetical protein